MKLDLKAEVVTLQNKQGIDYKVLHLNWLNKKTGEYIRVHEIYIKENLAQILQFLQDIESVE